MIAKLSLLGVFVDHRALGIHATSRPISPNLPDPLRVFSCKVLASL